MPRSKSKPRPPSSKLSLFNTRSDAKTVQKTCNAMWSCTNQAPLFLRRPKVVGSGKSKRRATYKNKRGEDVPIPQKMNRSFRRFPLRVLVSAATANAASIFASEANAMRIGVKGETNVSGALMQISKGAEVAIEQALVAYAQSAFQNAIALRDSMKLHKKVTAGSMSAATRILNNQLASCTGLSPGEYLLERKKPVIKKKSNTVTEAKASTEA